MHISASPAEKYNLNALHYVVKHALSQPLSTPVTASSARARPRSDRKLPDVVRAASGRAAHFEPFFVPRSAVMSPTAKEAEVRAGRT